MPVPKSYPKSSVKFPGQGLFWPPLPRVSPPSRLRGKHGKVHKHRFFVIPERLTKCIAVVNAFCYLNGLQNALGLTNAALQTTDFDTRFTKCVETATDFVTPYTKCVDTSTVFVIPFSKFYDTAINFVVERVVYDLY